MARTKRTRNVHEVVVDYVAAIERSALHYAINHHHPKWDAPRPYSRSLYLFGRWLLPAKFRGSGCEAFVYGDPDLSETPDELRNTTVASLRQRDDGLQVTIAAPLEFIATLSQAYADGRLNLIACRGAKLTRRRATLISVGFTDRASFECDWGEPLPPLDGERSFQS